MAPQVVLVLDCREQFGRQLGGRLHDGRVASRDESVRQIANLGVKVEVSYFLVDNIILFYKFTEKCNMIMLSDLNI